MFKLARYVGRRVTVQPAVTRPFSSWSQKAAGLPQETGVALILVMLVVALASILVINLAYSTYIGARINLSVERSLQAEYLLKSTLNVARVLIMSDSSPEDSASDPWALFTNGAVIPPELMSLTEPNIKVELEIRSEGSKIPLTNLRIVNPPGTSTDLKWRDALARLMEVELKFDEDKEEDQSGYFPGRVFTSRELVANLIDYQSDAKEPYQSGDYKGCKGDLPPDTFPGVRIMRVAELASIPGFTPLKVQRLSPFVTAGFASSTARVNINSAPAAILRALDERISDQHVQEIDAFRKDKERGPFKDGHLEELEQILGEDISRDIRPLIQASTTQFQVVAKVDYGTSTYFLRAYLDRNMAMQGMPPTIKSIELF